MAAEGDNNNNNMWDLIPTDVLVEVLQRLPTSSRRRSRLVCRLWRYTVDTRTTEMRSRPKTLIATDTTVHIVDDLEGSSPPRSRDLLAGGSYDGMSFVGTCNGIICMCYSQKPDRPMILANPVTGETLAIPPVPVPYTASAIASCSQLTYCFAYHPVTGKYKVVHVPYRFDSVWVFTVGDTLWRDVPTGCPMETLDLRNGGIVSVDGKVYWAVMKAMEAKIIMSFDLDGEHVASIGLQDLNVSCTSWHLTTTHGRLGVAFCNEWWMSQETEVWVMEQPTSMEAAAGPPPCTWSRWYKVHVEKPRKLTQPNFTHDDGKYLLTMRRKGQRHVLLYKHRLISVAGKNTKRRGMVEINKSNQGTLVADISTRTRGLYQWTFAYVETTEPLSVYSTCS